MRQTIRIALAITLACTAAGWAADQPTVDPGDAQLAEEFSSMATRLLYRPNPTASIWAESEALAIAAVRLNPREPRFLRTLVRYATRAGDTPTIIQADKSLLAIQPDNRAAQIQLIDIYVSQMETADQKNAYLKALISKKTLGSDIRSYAAVCLANVLLERSQVAAAREMIGQAINLNPLNLEALHLQYQIVEHGGSLLEKAIATMGLLRANPADPEMVWQLAELLGQAGLEKESLGWFAIAADAMPRSGRGMPEQLLTDYFSAAYLSDDVKNSAKLVDDTVANNPDTPHLWMLKAVMERQQSSPHLQDTIARANVAFFNSVQSIRQRTGSTDATTRPVDMAEPVTFPDTAIDLARITADNSGTLRQYYKINVGDWAFLQIYLAKKPDDVEPMIQFLTRIIAAEDPLLHRLRGWSALVKGDLDGAQAQFAAAPNDPLSEMGMIQIEQKHDPKAAQAQARALLSANSYGLTGAILYGQLKGDGVDLIPSNQSQAIAEQLHRFPGQFMTILESPQDFYSIHIDPIKTTYGYDEPMLVRIAIQNLTGLDFTIGENAMLSPNVLLDAQQRGIGDQLYPAVAFERFDSSLLLHGGDELSQIVRIDQGNFGLALMSDPESDLQYTLFATTNPIPVKNQVYVGLAGYRVQMPRVIERAASGLSSQSGRDHAMQMLSGNDGGEKIRAILLLANYAAQYVAGPNPAPAQLKASADLLHIIDENSHTGSTSVDAVAAFAMARAQPGDKGTLALHKMVADADWKKQLLGALGMSDAPADVQKKVYESLAGPKNDPIVKKYAAAALDVLAHPATQPTK